MCVLPILRARQTLPPRLSGSFHNYGGIRPRMHPAPRRCSSVKYSRYSPSSRLAGRAPPPPRCVAIITRRTTKWSSAVRENRVGTAAADGGRGLPPVEGWRPDDRALVDRREELW